MLEITFSRIRLICIPISRSCYSLSVDLNVAVLHDQTTLYYHYIIAPNSRSFPLSTLSWTVLHLTCCHYVSRKSLRREFNLSSSDSLVHFYVAPLFVRCRTECWFALLSMHPPTVSNINYQGNTDVHKQRLANRTFAYEWYNVVCFLLPLSSRTIILTLIYRHRSQKKKANVTI